MKWRGKLKDKREGQIQNAKPAREALSRNLGAHHILIETAIVPRFHLAWHRPVLAADKHSELNVSTEGSMCEIGTDGLLICWIGPWHRNKDV